MRSPHEVRGARGVLTSADVSVSVAVAVDVSDELERRTGGGR